MAGTKLRWVNGLSQLADSLTKANAKKDLTSFYFRFYLENNSGALSTIRNPSHAEEFISERWNENFARWNSSLSKQNWPWTEIGDAPAQYDPYTW